MDVGRDLPASHSAEGLTETAVVTEGAREGGESGNVVVTEHGERPFQVISVCPATPSLHRWGALLVKEW
jgi:hypothetical protein